MRRQQFSSILDERENLTPIMIVEHSYQLPSKTKTNTHAASCTLQQFPIRLAFGVTSHKVQGHTFVKGNTVVININKKKFPDGMAYVMLSRNCNLEDILINKKLTSSDIKCSVIAQNMNSILEEKHTERLMSKQKNYTLKFGFLNVRSIKKHFKDIADFYSIYNFDIFCLCETWILNEDDITSYELNPYLVHNNPRGRGKGLLTYYQKGKIVRDVNTEHIQSTLLQCESNLIVFMYCSSKCPIGEILELMSIINNDYLNLDKMFVGDFNFNANYNAKMNDWVIANNYIQCVNYPTHLLGNILDHAYLSNEVALTTTVKNSPMYFSDHVLLKITKNKTLK
jgi:hypothetical protein